ncbi:MAG: OmpA family protein, partial [Bryobacteraceae bacterium]
MLRTKRAAVLLGLSLVLLTGGCKKKPPAPPPPPPAPAPTAKETPPPAKPAQIVQFTAEPSSVERGQSSTLRWSVNNASEVRIDQGIGVVQANGNRTVFPSSSTTYTLSATGAGGGDKRTVTVSVTVPPPPPPVKPKPQTSVTQRLASDVQDAYFDYDKSDIREDGRVTLTRNAEALRAILRDFPAVSLLIEGHCDERGSAEYNLGLG